MFTQFKKGDILNSTIKAYPEVKFFIYSRKVYYNNKYPISGSHTSNIGCVDPGYISLYEENVDRRSNNYIYPFITKDGSLTAFKTVSVTSFNTDFAYGDTMTSSYPLKATISKDRYSSGQARSEVVALQNILNYWKAVSPHYAYGSGSTEFNLGNKETQELGVISIPSIFYGSSIKKGSVDLKFYVSGSLIGRLQDLKRNGELIQSEPVGSNGSGSCAGVVLYNEGFMILTGSWNIIETHTEPYIPGEAACFPKWIYFASTGSTGANENLPSSSFDIYFQGTQYVNTMTMLCHMGKGEYNYSNNPTFLDYGQSYSASTGSIQYVEPSELSIKNIVKTAWAEPSGSFEKTTYADKILLWDKDKNLIAIAKLAKPLRKREVDDLVVKLKLDF